MQFFLDLGITVCHDLSFNLHINNIVKKARGRTGLVKRCLGNNVNSNVKKTCYTILIRPIHEYCTQLWSPHNKNMVLLLESVKEW